MSAPEAVTPVTLWRGDHYEGDSFFLSESKHQRREEWKALPVDAYAALVAERDALREALQAARTIVLFDSAEDTQLGSMRRAMLARIDTALGAERG